MRRIITFFTLIAIFGCTQGDNMSINKKNPADAGKELRLKALTASAGELGFVPDKDYPEVYGVITDWNLGDHTATILAMKDGTASLYTTATFGVIGGQAHDTVRKAAQECVKMAGKYFQKSTPVSNYPYPKRGKVNFFLLTHNGVRLCIGDEDEINKGRDQTTPLFAAAQDIVTALRLITERKMKEETRQ